MLQDNLPNGTSWDPANADNLEAWVLTLTLTLTLTSPYAYVLSGVFGWIAGDSRCSGDPNAHVCDSVRVCGRAAVCGAMQATGTLHGLTLISTVFIYCPVCLDDMGCGRWQPINRCTIQVHTRAHACVRECVTQALLVTRRKLSNGARCSEESVTTFDRC